MNRKEFIKGLLIGGAGLSLLPGVLVGKNAKVGRLSRVNLKPVRDHVRHGMFSPWEEARMENGPNWLSHFRVDRFHSNGFAAADADLLHVTLGLAGKPLGITFKEGETFVGQENGGAVKVRLPKQGKARLFQSRHYEIWMLSGNKKADFPANESSELFLSTLSGKASLNGYASTTEHAVWGRQLSSPDLRQDVDTRSLLLVKFA